MVEFKDLRWENCQISWSKGEDSSFKEATGISFVNEVQSLAFYQSVWEQELSHKLCDRISGSRRISNELTTIGYSAEINVLVPNLPLFPGYGTKNTYAVEGFYHSD